jgi:hypothetical protein
VPPGGKSAELDSKPNYYYSPIKDIALRNRTTADVCEAHLIRGTLNAVYRILLNESFHSRNLGG